MKRPSREEYERAVSLARAAIEEYKARPRIRADRSPQALLARLQERQAKGEPVTDADLAGLAAALAEREAPKRGRPKGTRNVAAHGAFWAALFATDDFGLQPYRNRYPGRHVTAVRFTLCDAIAEAMHAAGFRNLATYNAASDAMKAARRDLKGARQSLSRFSRTMQQQLQEMTRGAAPAMAALRAQQESLARALGALSQRIRSDPALMAELQKTRRKRDATTR